MTTVLLSCPVLVIKTDLVILHKGNLYHFAKNFPALLTHNNVCFVLNDVVIVHGELGRMWE
jgi:GTP:adenosylcobinamide-phosphate guanylyltransferase